MGDLPVREALPSSFIEIDAITRLLQGGDYDDAAQQIFELQQFFQAEYGTSFLTTLVGMTFQLCLLLSRCSAEIEWYREAGTDAEKREIALREQLYITLKLAGELARGRTEVLHIAIEMLPPALDAAPSYDRTLWQQLRRLLKRQPAEVAPALPLSQPTIHEAGMSNHVPLNSPAIIMASQANAADTPRLVVYALGAFEAYSDDEHITRWDSRKGQSILKYLLLHHKQPIHKERLMEVFWRDATEETARNSLNVAICALRKSLRGADPDFSHIIFRDDCYLLNPQLSIWLDYDAFLQHVESGRRAERGGDTALAIAEYEAAALLYQGMLFGEHDYEDWSQPLREHAQDCCLELLVKLSEYYLAQADYHNCIALCNKALAIEPAQELMHSRLMRCYSRQQQPYLAQRQYERCLLALRELNAKPSGETITLITQIRQGQVA
jgi:DNA-binding SARP family transcriptional activator